MQVFDLFNTDHERRLTEGAVDRLEQRRIDDLNMKMDELAHRVKSTSNPEHKKSLLKAFLAAKEERDGYYKVKTNEGSMKHMMHKDAERMSREKFCDTYGDEHGEFWDNINLDEAAMGQPQSQQMARPQTLTPHQQAILKDPRQAAADKAAANKAARLQAIKDNPYQAGADRAKKRQAANAAIQGAQSTQARTATAGKPQPMEAGIGHDIANKAEKIARATPQSKAGAVASTVKNAAKWLAGKGGPGREGPTYEQEELDEKLKGLPTKKLGSARDAGKSVRKFRAQRGLEEAGTDSQWSKESDWKEVPKSKSGKPVDPRGEVTHLSDVARREAERKADQKKNSEKVNEYISMGSDKNYMEAEPYKNYKIYVRKKPFGNTGIYTAHTEIDRKEFMGKGSSQEEAVQAIRDRIDFVLNAQKKVTGSSTIDFNVKFATDLLADPRQTFYAKLENVKGQPKLIIAGTDIANDPELLAAGDFKRSALRNQVDDQGRATPLPGIPLTAKSLRAGDWIANGRYTVGNETTDSDGNRVFDLTYHSTAHTKSDKLRLNQPAFTLGTAREVDEGFQDFNKVEPYAVCLAGKPVKKFDYYEEARRFHDNWKQKLYREGDMAKAEKITLMPLNLDEEQKPANPNEFRPVGPITIMPPKKLKSGETHRGINDYWKAHGQAPVYKTNEAGSPAQQAAIAIAMKRAGKKPKSVDEDQWDSGEDVTVTQDDQSTVYQYKGCKFVVNGEEAQGEAWWYEPGDTWRDADHYTYEYDEAKGIDRFYDNSGQNVFNLSATNQSQWERFVKAKAKDFVSTMAAQPSGPTMHEAQGVTEADLDENLRDWFGKEKWVRMDTKGNIKGDCARGSETEGKPKCLPQAKAHALGKKGRASAAQKKRREDPNPERRGKAINVATKVKEDDLDEACWKGYHKDGMKTMFGKRYPNCVKNTKEDIDEAGRIARKAGQPANSKKHSDLYTDENPQGTITGLKFASVEDARASVSKIRSSGRSHAHKVQAAVAMEQRARAAGKVSAAAVYRAYINSVKKTDENAGNHIVEILSTRNQDEIRRIQHMLNIKYNANLDVDGQLGPLTIKSIKKFLPAADTASAPDPQRTTAVQGLKNKLMQEQQCPECGGAMYPDTMINEKQDACYFKVKSRYKVWPSAYASGALVQCRKKGAANWGNKSESVDESYTGVMQSQGITDAKLLEVARRIDLFAKELK